MRLLFLLTSLALGACATPTTGVIPTGTGYFTVSHQGDGAWVTTQTLRGTALNEANDYCDKKKQVIQVVHVKEIPAGGFGRWPEAEVIFSCR